MSFLSFFNVLLFSGVCTSHFLFFIYLYLFVCELLELKYFFSVIQNF